MPDANIFLWIAASVAKSAAANPEGIKMVLATGRSIFPIKGNSVFSNGPKSLPGNLLNVLFYAFEFSIILY